MKQNKFNYIVVLQGFYCGRWEDLCAAQNDRQGTRQISKHLYDYRKNEKGSYRIIRRREIMES